MAGGDLGRRHAAGAEEKEGAQAASGASTLAHPATSACQCREAETPRRVPTSISHLLAPLINLRSSLRSITTPATYVKHNIPPSLPRTCSTSSPAVPDHWAGRRKSTGPHAQMNAITNSCTVTPSPRFRTLAFSCSTSERAFPRRFCRAKTHSIHQQRPVCQPCPSPSPRSQYPVHCCPGAPARAPHSDDDTTNGRTH